MLEVAARENPRFHGRLIQGLSLMAMGLVVVDLFSIYPNSNQIPSTRISIPLVFPQLRVYRNTLQLHPLALAIFAMSLVEAGLALPMT